MGYRWIFLGWTGPVALWSPDSEHKSNFNGKGMIENNFKHEPATLGFRVKTYYMNWYNQENIWIHFGSLDDLEVGYMVISILCRPSSSQTPETGNERLQWQSLGVRLYLSFQKATPLHPTDSVPLDREENGRRTNKVRLKTSSGLNNMHRLWCDVIGGGGGGGGGGGAAARVDCGFHLVLVHIICRGVQQVRYGSYEDASRAVNNLICIYRRRVYKGRADVLHKATVPWRQSGTEERPQGDKKTDLFYNIHSDRWPAACSTS